MLGKIDDDGYRTHMIRCRQSYEGCAKWVLQDSCEQDMTTISRHFIQRKVHKYPCMQRCLSDQSCTLCKSQTVYIRQDVTEDNPVPYMEKSAVRSGGDE